MRAPRERVQSLGVTPPKRPPDNGSPPGRKGGDGGRLTLISAIVTAVIGAAALITVAVINDDPDPAPTPTPAPSVAAIHVTFTKPTSARINPGDDVKFEGVVSGLPPGQVMWLISRTPKSSSLYYIIGESPVATRDGPFDATAFSLGDDSDHGKFRTFFGVAADQACTDVISGGVDESPRTVTGLGDTCRPLNPIVKVSFN
jgi:hypothetical protein